MIHLTKLNGEPLILNCKLIEYVELIPETKIVMINGKFHLVQESAEVVVDRTVNFYARIRNTEASEVFRQEQLNLEDNADAENDAEA